MEIPRPLLEYHQLSFCPFLIYLGFHNLKISMDQKQRKFEYLQQLPISFPDETATWLGDVAVDVGCSVVGDTSSRGFGEPAGLA